ncbi:MAG: hypothetical protein Q8M07_08740 [Prosthecobacter sp.]|nr:hypothetical protein [Prosthecobacter sp.]
MNNITISDTFCQLAEPILKDHNAQTPVPVAPDFLARAQAIWGANPEGKPLSEFVLEGRGV